MQQQQRTAWFAGFYRTQIESAQDLTTASIEGFERIQQLALQAVRQQLDDQVRLVNAMTSRSAEVLVGPDLARPAFERMIDVQRQMADAVVQTNQRVLSAVNSSAQRAAEQGASLGGSGGLERDDAEGYPAVFNSALQQWQEFANRMLDVFQEQFVAVTDEAQRQGQRALEQTSRAMQEAGRGVPTTARAEQGGEQRPSGPQNDSSQAGRGPKSPERKHEIA